jgi:hypothetical protein
MTGSCLCGRARYEIDGAFRFLGNCHCVICRKVHGAAFVTWGILGPGQFRWAQGEEELRRYESSPGTHRCSCGHCGSHLACEHGGAVGEVVVATLDCDPGARPCEHIFVGSRAPWHEITDHLPQYEEWPPQAES